MILTAQEVLKRMKDPFPRKLVITPLLHLDQIHKITGSVDIRLGQEFIIAHQAALGALNPVQDPDDLSGQITDYLRKKDIDVVYYGNFESWSNHLFLHPTICYHFI